MTTGGTGIGIVAQKLTEKKNIQHGSPAVRASGKVNSGQASGRGSRV